MNNNNDIEANQSDSLVSLKCVYKSYKTKYFTVEVLKDLNLEIKKNQFVSIMGPSGSGKTTLLNIIGLIDSIDQGKYILGGSIDVSTLQVSELRKLRLQKIGFVFQAFNLIQSLNAIENVELPLALNNIPESIQKQKAERALELVGLGNKALHLPNQMSMGEQQRVAIARVIAMEPLLIIADEPTGNLDKANTKLILDLLESLQKEKRLSLIVSSHNSIILDYSKIHFKLENGRCVNED